MKTQTNRVHIFIDESGTMGKRKKEPYFVIVALVLGQEQYKPIKNVTRRVFKETDSCANELHAMDMSFKEKQHFFERIRKLDYSIDYHVSHKASIEEKLFAKKNICFNFFVHQLIHNHLHDPTIDELHILLDNRSIKVGSLNNLEEYLTLQLVEQGSIDKDIKVSYGNSKNYYHLQAVDIFSNGIYARYNYGKNHFYKKFESKIEHRVLFPYKHFR